MILNKIHCSDNVLGMKKYLSDNSIDLTITSSPYGSLRNYNGFSWNFKNIANELFRVTKEGAVIVWVIGDETIKGSESGESFKQALYFKEIGFNIHDTMIYEKHNFAMPSTTRYHQVFEYMFVFSKGKPKTFNPICDRANKYAGHTTYGKNRKQGKNGMIEWDCKPYKDFGMRTNIFRYVTTGSKPNERKIQHPAKFPLELANDMMVSWSNEGDIIFDPFMGSGTVAVSAKNLKRNYIGFEISEDYCKIAEDRINEYGI